MPFASLSTFAVMNPGPTTARKRTSRLRHSLRRKSIACVSVTMSQHRDHLVGGDDAGQASMCVDDGERDQVVFVEERRDLVLRRVRRAGDVRLAQIGQLRAGRRDGDPDERHGSDEPMARARQVDRRERFTAPFESLQRLDGVVDDGCFGRRDELGRHAAGRGVFGELEELRHLLPLLGLHLLEDLARSLCGQIAEQIGDLPAERSGEILKEMQPEERQEVTQLLEFAEHTAAGRMTTEFIAAPETAVVDDAIEALKRFEGSREALATIYLTGPGHRLVGSVPLVRIAISSPGAQLSDLSEPYVACAPDTPEDEVAALFDKYNLITLAVVDEHGRLTGIITADDVITMLRHRH